MARAEDDAETAAADTADADGDTEPLVGAAVGGGAAEPSAPSDASTPDPARRAD